MQAKNDPAAEFRHMLAEKVRTLRTTRNLTTLKLSHIADALPSGISKIENGENVLFESYHKVVRGLGLEASDIITRPLYPTKPLPPLPAFDVTMSARRLLDALETLHQSVDPILDTLNSFAPQFLDDTATDERTPMLITLGERIRVFRELRELTIAKISKDSGITAKTLHLLERGCRNPSLDTLVQIGREIAIPLEFIMFTNPILPAEIRPYFIVHRAKALVRRREDLHNLLRDHDTLQEDIRD